MSYRDPQHPPVFEEHELQVEQLLREFFRRHLPEQLPPLRFHALQKTLGGLERSVSQAQQEPLSESCLSPRLYPETTPPYRSAARTGYWSRLLLVTAVVLLGWLLLLAPWLMPKPASGPVPHLDPSDGFARDKPPPISIPKSSSLR